MGRSGSVLLQMQLLKSVVQNESWFQASEHGGAKVCIDPKVEVRGQNAAEGMGVFSLKDFKKGDFIGFFEGGLVERRTRTTLQFAPDFHVEPAENSPFRYLNHSCDPNSYFVGRNLYAWRDIRAGEEITIDYNCHEPELASPFKCKCAAARCVGEIRGYDYLTEAQKEDRQGKVCAWLARSTKKHEGSIQHQ